MQLTYKKLLSVLLLLAGTTIAVNAQNTEPFINTAREDSILNIGFAKQPTRLVTSAISTVKGTELQKTFNLFLGGTLYGRLPGLTVTSGGNEPGNNAPSINGRGVNTFGNGKNILIIVDGFIGDYNQLVPEEIEEISLLKDASATAIYGSRAA
jgi:TonB-dependent SusC/RagA subfamily outer membrane receptor